MIPITFAVGRFNPPTKGHQELIRNLFNYKTSNGKIMLFIVDGSETSKNKITNPLSAPTRKKLLKHFFPGVTIDVINSPYDIFDILEVQNMCPKYWITGNDRTAGYQKLVEHANSDCKVIGIDRNSRIAKKISATAAREAARNNDFEAFKQLLPAQENDEILKKIMIDIINSTGE